MAGITLTIFWMLPFVCFLEPVRMDAPLEATGGFNPCATIRAAGDHDPNAKKTMPRPTNIHQPNVLLYLMIA
jgi:hypothetical protein